MTDDEAKDEVLRILDDDEWEFSLWMAKHHFAWRWLFLAQVGVAVAGMFVFKEEWPKAVSFCLIILVLWTYLRIYGCGIKNTVARLRSHFRRGVQDQK